MKHLYQNKPNLVPARAHDSSAGNVLALQKLILSLHRQMKQTTKLCSIIDCYKR